MGTRTSPLPIGSYDVDFSPLTLECLNAIGAIYISETAKGRPTGRCEINLDVLLMALKKAFPNSSDQFEWAEALDGSVTPTLDVPALIAEICADPLLVDELKACLEVMDATDVCAAVESCPEIVMTYPLDVTCNPTTTQYILDCLRDAGVNI